MAISDRLATARRTTLATCLCASLAAGAGIHNGIAHNGDASIAQARADIFLPHARTPRKTSTRPHAPNVIPVTNCADDGTDGTLRMAIDAASDGDTIDMSALSCSSITLQSGALMSSVPNLVLKGPGVDALTVDGNNADRVLMGYNLDVSDLTIAHGVDLSGTGGGCISADGDLALNQARLSNCLEISGTANAVGGGAVVVGNLTMHNAAITDSKASGLHYAVGGGAIVGGTATIYGSKILGNTADASQMPALGGGLCAFGPVTLHASVVDGNVAHSVDAAAYGGGVHGYADIAAIDDSIVSSNAASSDTSWSSGGGVNQGTVSQSDAVVLCFQHMLTRASVLGLFHGSAGSGFSGGLAGLARQRAT